MPAAKPSFTYPVALNADVRGLILLTTSGAIPPWLYPVALNADVLKGLFLRTFAAIPSCLYLILLGTSEGFPCKSMDLARNILRVPLEFHRFC